MELRIDIPCAKNPKDLGYYTMLDDGSFNLHFGFESGKVAFILGANGSGKSALMHFIFSQISQNARRISAHRQTWFSEELDLTPNQKKNYMHHIKADDLSAEARWKDRYHSQRVSLSLFDLISAENSRARTIAQAIDRNLISEATAMSRENSPLRHINSILKFSNIPIKIEIHDDEKVMAKRDNGASYSVAQLSDGERNALLIATDVLTSPPETVLLIDEPEKHLHRSIIIPLLLNLYNLRRDCIWFISTHDIDIATSINEATIFLVRNCFYQDNNVRNWDIAITNNQQNSDYDDVKRDIVGSRSKLLFVEGSDASLDRSLYSLVFPNVSVIAKSSCKDVENAVLGARILADRSWVRAWGIIDRDYRSEKELSSLVCSGIYSLPFYSVESIYYHRNVIKMVANSQQRSHRDSADTMIQKAEQKSLVCIEQQKEYLVNLKVRQLIRQKFMANMPPKKEDYKDLSNFSFDISISDIYQTELKKIQEIIDNSDIVSIIKDYPIRETGAPKAIANALGFIGKQDYEFAVRKLLAEDQDNITFIRSFFQNLVDQINED